MLKNIGDYFDGNTAEVNADMRYSDEIAHRSVLKTANIKQISKSVSSGIALMLLQPEKQLYKLVRVKKTTQANILDVCICDSIVYFAIQQPNTRQIFVLRKQNNQFSYLSAGFSSKVAKFECNTRD